MFLRQFQITQLSRVAVPEQDAMVVSTPPETQSIPPRYLEGSADRVISSMSGLTFCVPSVFGFSV